MPGVSFLDHTALLTELLNRHDAIVAGIENRLLNVQGKDAARNRSRDDFDRILNSCFYGTPGLPRALSEPKGQLHASHVADGFEPVVLDGAAHTLDPLELILRAYDIWEHARWPGRNGRLSYARVLFGVFLLRQLEALSLRIWDDDTALAGDRLRNVQGVLDRLNDLLGPNLLVRDARWLIQTAQGPLTRHLAPYFRIADRIGESFAGDDGLALHAAGAGLAGGHLRSQLRYRTVELGLPVDHPDVLAVTRNSNALDTALLVRDLVPLLEAYRRAMATDDSETRLELADAILQGISADPELFITRLDLLGPCTTIETLFVERAADGMARCTRMGAAHDEIVGRYSALVGELAGALGKDAQSLDPSNHTYSPLGLAYGFCADLLSNMALSTVQGQPPLALSLEDMFEVRANQENKLARARGWERLPARTGERERFEYSQEWAAQVFHRTMDALGRRAGCARANASSVRDARVFVVPREPTSGPFLEELPDGVVSAQGHCVSSDINRALSRGTTAFPRSQILADRNEGRFLASAEIDGKWFGVSKTILSEVIGQGLDTRIVDVPEQVVAVLRVTCPGLIVVVGGTNR